MSVCTVEGCRQEAHARGLCRKHYDEQRYGRFRADGSKTLPWEGTWICEVDGCEKPRKCARGRPSSRWCAMHSTRAQRHGDIHVTHRLNESHRTPAPDYRRAHKWVAKAKGRAALHTCVKCGHEAHEWAYDNADPAELIDKATGLRYSTDPAHYLPMCRKCHGAFDAECRKAWMSLHARRVHNTSMSGPYEDSTTQPRWATKEQAAEHLGVSVKTIIRWADEGRIRRHRFGPRLIRFDLNEIDAMSTPTSTKAAAQ